MGKYTVGQRASRSRKSGAWWGKMACATRRVSSGSDGSIVGFNDIGRLLLHRRLGGFLLHHGLPRVTSGTAGIASPHSTACLPHPARGSSGVISPTGKKAKKRGNAQRWLKTHPAPQLTIEQLLAEAYELGQRQQSL